MQRYNLNQATPNSAPGGRAIFKTVSSAICLLLLISPPASAADSKQVLIFGGNGFIGASAVEQLLSDDAKVTIVNRGNSYWDSQDRISHRVQHIECDRKNGLASCRPLVAFINATTRFDAVIDFSAYDGNATRDSTSLLKDKVGIYILISTDSVYDVCEKTHHGTTIESDAVRPELESERLTLAAHHQYGDNKLQAEESLAASGVPYVALRLPDVFGPRDTTYRWWLYQLWLRTVDRLPHRPVTVPVFLKDYQISFVYVEDVARAVATIVASPSPQLVNEAINLAYPETVLLAELLEEIRRLLDTNTPLKVDDESRDAAHFYLYPSARNGPLNVTKAQNLLGWSPTPWAEAVDETVKFYEKAALDTALTQQRDEIIQIVSNQLHGTDMKTFYTILEEIYNIDLEHFKHTARDEL